MHATQQQTAMSLRDTSVRLFFRNICATHKSLLGLENRSVLLSNLLAFWNILNIFIIIIAHSQINILLLIYFHSVLFFSVIYWKSVRTAGLGNFYLKSINKFCKDVHLEVKTNKLGALELWSAAKEEKQNGPLRN